MDFLRALRERGYGEVAVDYLDQLKKRGDLPEELAETWDLEMSTSLRLAARDPFSKRERDRWLAKSEEYLKKFLKEHPNHSKAGDAVSSSGDLIFDTGVQQLEVARLTKDADQKKTALAEARKAFEQARPRFVQATELCQKRLAELREESQGKEPPPQRAGKKARRPPPRAKNKESTELTEATLSWLDARFKVANTDYNLAQTYPDPANPTRKSALQQALKAFDSIYQDNRARDGEDNLSVRIELYSHAWHGKCAQESGNLDLAEAIYDEVLAREPEKTQKTEFDGLFAEVNYFRLLCIKAKDVEKFREDAVPWLQLRGQNWKQYDGYQGVALELAKTELALAEKASGDQKGKHRHEALTLLKATAKVRCKYQQEAILLLRQLAKTTNPGGANTFDEAVALAEDAVAGGQWPEAVNAWQQAVALGEKSSLSKDKARLEKVKEALHVAQFRAALKKLSQDKSQAAQAGAELERIAREFPQSSVAAAAAAQATGIALNAYATAPNPQAKEAARKHFTDIAQYTIKQWPDKAEADDVRISLGQANRLRNELDEAIKVFERINPRSQHYATGQLLAGQTHYQMYLIEKKRPSANRNVEQMAEHLKGAEARLRSCMDLLSKTASAGPASARDLNDAQIRLAEVYLEEGKNKEAIELVQPLVDGIVTAKPDAVEPAMFRTFVIAAKAYIALGEVAKASQIATQLTTAGADVPDVNARLTSLARLLNEEARRAETVARELRESKDANPVEAQKADAAVNGTKELLGQLLDRLGRRQQNSLADKIFIATASSQVGRTDIAGELYSQILKQADEDPKFSKDNEQQLTRIRADLVGLERQKGQFKEALEQIDKLIATRPNALPLLMERGRILQSLGETDPSKFDETVAHWTDLRNKLATQKKKPPEYYEVSYNVALTLFNQFQKTKDQKKAEQAEQLLNAMLVLSPNLNGPDTVAKFKELLDRVKKVTHPQGDTAARR